MEYVSRDEAMEIVKITTRQGLHKFVKKYDIGKKQNGIGKPTFYKREDLLKAYAEGYENKIKCVPYVEKKAKEKKVKKEKVIKKHIETKEETKKELCLNVEDVEINKPIIKDFRMDDLLNEIGQNEFDRVMALLIDNGTYKDEDRSLVLTYAVNFQNWVFATVASAREDNTTMDAIGNLKLHPYFQVAKEAFNQMEKSAKLIGIGVRSRQGLEIKAPKKESIFDVLNGDDEF